jgi:hypothetical protein
MGGKKKPEIHKAYQEGYKLHAKVGSYDNGACLCKHVVRFKESDSCSYRWQGVHKASMSPGRQVYDAHENPKHRFAGRGAGAFAPQDVAAATAPGGAMGGGEVVAVSKYKLKSIIEVNNFTTASVPYGNQVHHVLNASSLHKGIDDVAKIWAAIRWTIVDGLLEEKYSINHFENNLICPTRDYHCRQTGLPKHVGGHQKYSNAIKTRVKNALKPYEAIANQMKDGEKHDPLDPEKLKEALVQISTVTYTNLISLAIANRGKVITMNNVPAATFPKV